jgi:phage FluMu protein Com
MLEILTAYAVCDYCRTKIFLASGEDWLNYHRTWFEGVLDEYCPACRELPDIRALIAEETQITTSFRNEPTAEIEDEYPEFIYEK